MDDDKELIEFEEAIKLLPEGDTVHTLIESRGCLIGAYHKRERLIKAMRSASAIEVTGSQAQAMGHGLAIWDEQGWLFIATKPLVRESLNEIGGILADLEPIF